jgi:hypothetical protein
MLAGAALLGLSTVGRAATLYADNNLKADITNGSYSIASRDATGSDGNAYTAIQEAVRAMKPGDTLLLRGGVFKEHSISLFGKHGSATAWFTIRSFPGEWAVVDAGHAETSDGKTVNVFRSSSGRHEDAPTYWRFEWFEVTGGGPALIGQDGKPPTYNDIQPREGAGFFFWPGFHLVFDHLYIHDNYGGGGPNGGAGIKLMNASGATHHTVVTHCWLKDNGWPGSANGNLSNIIFFADYRVPQEVNLDVACSRNEVCYNLLDGSAHGFKHKAQQSLVRNNAGDDMEAKAQGDKFHHNIVRNSLRAGLWIAGDFAQVYNNIVDSSPGGIMVSDPPSTPVRERFHVVVYNNLVINGTIALHHGTEKDHPRAKLVNYWQGPRHPFWYCWNNIIENAARKGSDQDIRDLYVCHTWIREPLEIDMNTVHVDHDYFYPRTRADQVINVGRDRDNYSVDEYQARGWAKSPWANLADPADPLHKSGSRYKTRGEHAVGGGRTIANGGLGQPHPYLDGTAIPRYLGAADPNGDAWVDTVLSLEQLGRSMKAPAKQ